MTVMAIAVGGVVGGIATVMLWFAMASFAKDPTSNGAYAAVAMITSPIGMIAGAVLSGVLMWRMF